MKKFVFRFESILKMRADKEAEIGGELATLMNELSMIEHSLHEYIKQSDAYMRDIDQKKEDGTSVYEICVAEEGRQYYKTQIEAMEEKKRVQLDKIALKRAELTEAMKKRKVMEKLKEKAHDEYVEDFEREERKIIEEIVTYKGFVKEK